ncbi:hypothetical protein BDZ89DRAFT_1149926 [Hymenopellis radicata]|nr:hypothetical protein BDZ89DRAFT_1149926 [Hymenopellis radicata]
MTLYRAPALPLTGMSAPFGLPTLFTSTMRVRVLASSTLSSVSTHPEYDQRDANRGSLVTALGRSCATLFIDVDIVKTRATRSPDNLRNEDLSRGQLEKLETTKAALNEEKLKHQNHKRSVIRKQADLDDYNAIFDLLAQEMVPGLYRFFPRAKKEQWGISKLLCMLKKALRGEYTPRGYTQFDIDMATLILEHVLTPCIDGVRITDVLDNVEAMYGPKKQKCGAILAEDDTDSQRYGFTACFDELATEGRIDYMADEDKMAGVCLEHVGNLTGLHVGSDLRAIEGCVDAAKARKVHVARETTVGAISRHSRKGYAAKPVFMGPTCKKGNYKNAVHILGTVVEAWKRSPYGEKKNGPLWDLASDGDATRRAAMFITCMTFDIEPNNPLYPHVHDLPGLNLKVGKDNLTMDFDYKHLFKEEGMMVNGFYINKSIVARWLERLPDHDWSEVSIESLLVWSERSIDSLLNPDDAQDVPRAVELLAAIIELQRLENLEMDPTELSEYRALRLLGETFKALLKPFITPTLSLSEQIESLILFSHLACALYLKNGPSFLSNQLYGDLQAMVKNGVLTVVKAKLISSTLEVFVCLLGDDVLERLFGIGRMIGGHSPNCTIVELRHLRASPGVAKTTSSPEFASGSTCGSSHTGEMEGRGHCWKL